VIFGLREQPLLQAPLCQYSVNSHYSVHKANIVINVSRYNTLLPRGHYLLLYMYVINSCVPLQGLHLTKHKCGIIRCNLVGNTLFQYFFATLKPLFILMNLRKLRNIVSLL